MAANPANGNNGTPLLRELIDIKPEVSSSDYVLQLADATTADGAAKALADYVVTDDLVQHFNEALGIIKSAVDSHSSKAAYLHASFGAGKSHFMAVLHALLNQAPAARGKTDFDPVFAKNGWLQDGERRFLMVPVHMLDAKSMEQRILGGYVKRIRELEPGAPTPRVYRTDAMFRDLQSMRDRLGDEDVIKFLAGATPAQSTGEWGEFGAAFTWTTELLDEAMAAEELEVGQEFNPADPSTPGELRARLAQDAAKVLPGYEERAVEQDGGFISLDRGLSVIAQHAKSLNYDGIVLFLDELILWFASRISSSEFVSRETAKITNLVEGGDERRAVPVVSFIARQRDLRDLVGSAEDGGRYQRAIVDNLELASGRFDRISLEDRNLPQIAHARLLKPLTTEADAVIGEAFKKAKSTNAKFWDELLGGDENNVGATETAFRFTYPFSPAFMDTLVHLSSALQRSRTGLKLMGELLAARRNLLRVGQLVPLGDIYALISGGGDKPFTDELRAVFDEADRLYRNRMRPYLLDQYRVAEEQVAAYQQDPAAIEDGDLARRLGQFTDDDRLMSTLVLSALAPAAPAFQNMTVKRLLALNAGTIKALLPGGEIPALINKLKEWAGRIPEIKLAGDGVAMTVRLELSGVDIDSVVRNGREAFDKPRYRHDAAVEMLRSEFALTAAKGQGGFDAYDTLDFTWRGSKRRTEVVFANIADREETPDSMLTPVDVETWRLVVDLPWDEGEFGPREDLNRMNSFWERHPEVQHSLTWVPTHMTTTMYADFNRYVVIKRILNSGSDFDSRFAAHLGPDDRVRARGLLTTQAETLRDRVLAAFKQAYGLAKKQEGDVLDDFSEHIATKPGAPTPALGLSAAPRDAIRDIAGKMLAWQYPAHPDLGPGTVTPAQARTVLGYVSEAAGAREGKAEIARGDQGLMRTVAQPLKLGTMGESYFTLGGYWRDHFNRLAKNDPDADIGYGSLTACPAARRSRVRRDGGPGVGDRRGPRRGPQAGRDQGRLGTAPPAPALRVGLGDGPCAVREDLRHEGPRAVARADRQFLRRAGPYPRRQARARQPRAGGRAGAASGLPRPRRHRSHRPSAHRTPRPRPARGTARREGARGQAGRRDPRRFRPRRADAGTARLVRHDGGGSRACPAERLLGRTRTRHWHGRPHHPPGGRTRGPVQPEAAGLPAAGPAGDHPGPGRPAATPAADRTTSGHPGLAHPGPGAANHRHLTPQGRDHCPHGLRTGQRRRGRADPAPGGGRASRQGHRDHVEGG